jgi:hypothetical protein
MYRVYQRRTHHIVGNIICKYVNKPSMLMYRVYQRRTHHISGMFILIIKHFIHFQQQFNFSFIRVHDALRVYDFIDYDSIDFDPIDFDYIDFDVRPYEM